MREYARLQDAVYFLQRGWGSHNTAALNENWPGAPGDAETIIREVNH